MTVEQGPVAAHYQALGIAGAIELLEIAESANPPSDGHAIDADWVDRVFPAKDGWHVEVFYDGYSLDYVSEFIAPSGERLDFSTFGNGRPRPCVRP